MKLGILFALVLLAVSIEADARPRVREGICPFYGPSYGALSACKNAEAVQVDRSMIGTYVEPSSGFTIRVSRQGISLDNYQTWATCGAIAVRTYKRALEDNPHQKPSVPSCFKQTAAGGSVSVEVVTNTRWLGINKVYMGETLTVTREQDGSYSMRRSKLYGSPLFGIPEGSWHSPVALKKIK